MTDQIDLQSLLYYGRPAKSTVSIILWHPSAGQLVSKPPRWGKGGPVMGLQVIIAGEGGCAERCPRGLSKTVAEKQEVREHGQVDI